MKFAVACLIASTQAVQMEAESAFVHTYHWREQDNFFDGQPFQLCNKDADGVCLYIDDSGRDEHTLKYD